MKGNSSKGNPLIAAISKRLRRIRGDRLAAIQGRINSRKTLEKVEKHLARWVRDGKHHECYDSMEEILDELDLTNQELSFYCSRILNKKFLTWRKEIRIEDAKKAFYYRGLAEWENEKGYLIDTCLDGQDTFKRLLALFDIDV